MSPDLGCPFTVNEQKPGVSPRVLLKLKKRALKRAGSQRARSDLEPNQATNGWVGVGALKGEQNDKIPRIE